MSQQRNIQDEVVINLHQEENDSSTSSLDDADRHELLWTSKLEVRIKKWGDHCRAQSVGHGKKARNKKKLYQAVMVPSIIIPLVMTGIGDVLREHPHVNSAMMITVSVITGLNGFLGLSKASQNHFCHEGLYADLVLYIDGVLAKPKKGRIAADVMLERIRLSISKLDLSAPPL